MTVQLKDIGLQRIDDAGKRSVVGIDRQSDLHGPPVDRSTELARGLKREVTRRGRKKHEPHHVGAGIQRRVERLARG